MTSNIFIVSVGTYDFVFEDGNDAITFANRCKKRVMIDRKYHFTMPSVKVEILTPEEYDEQYPALQKINSEEE